MRSPRFKTRNKLRCEFCEHKPLLAMYGITENDEPYVHIRILKQSRVYGEVLITHGEIELMCRECKRWLKLRIINRNKAQLEIKERPRFLAPEARSGVSLPVAPDPV